MTRFVRPLLVTLLLVLAACGGAEDRKTAYVNKGLALYAEKNYEKARIEFQNALQIEPKDLEARFHLAETLEKLENWQGAAGHYLAIINEDPAHKGALLNMGRLYLLGNNDEQAAEHAEKVLTLEPENTSAMTLSAAIKAKRGDRDTARTMAERVLELKPHDPEAVSLLSSLLLVEGKVDESVALLQGAIAANPEEVALSINLARVQARAGQNDAAVETLRNVVAQHPDQLAYRTALARLLIGFQRVDEAEAVLKQAVTDFPDDRNAKLGYVEFLSASRGVDLAIAELEQYIAAAPEDNQLVFALGKIYEATNRVDEAAKLYDGVVARVKEGPDVLTAKTRLAIVKARQQEFVEARRLVDEVLTENARDGDALVLRGTLLLNEGDAAGAIADLRTVLRDTPTNVGAIRLLSRAHLANKEPALALDVLRDGIKNNPGADALGLDLANYHASRNEVDEAQSALDAVLARNPAEPQALEGKFKVMVFRKDFDGAMKVAEQFKSVLPNDVRGYHFAGLVRQAKGELEASIGEFQSALDHEPGAVQPLSQLIKSYLALDRRDDAVARLKQAIEEQPDNYVAHNLLGELFLANKELEPAEQAFARAIELNGQWAIPYRNLASVYVASERRDEAITLMKQGIEATNGSALLLTGLAAYLEQTGELDQAIAEYEKALEKQPDSALAANNLAMLLAEYRGEDKASLERARELATPLRNSNQAAFLDTVGWIEYKLGEYEQARLFLEKAVEAAPDSNLLHYHLGMVHFAAGNEGGAREHLARALETEVEFKGKDEAQATLRKLSGGA